MAQNLKKNLTPPSVSKKRRWFLEIDMHTSRYYWRRHWYAYLTPVDGDERIQIPVVKVLTAFDARQLNDNDKLSIERLNIFCGEEYKAGDLTERFSNHHEITSHLDRQIVCSRLPIDEVWLNTEDDTILIWSRKTETD